MKTLVTIILCTVVERRKKSGKKRKKKKKGAEMLKLLQEVAEGEREMPKRVFKVDKGRKKENQLIKMIILH